MEPTQGDEDKPATAGAVRHAQWSINLTTLITAGGALLSAVAALLIGGWSFLGQARAEGRAAAIEVVSPIVPRVTFLEAQVPFTLLEVRAVREEQRALAEKGRGAPELSRPMAPLPLPPDAGL